MQRVGGRPDVRRSLIASLRDSSLDTVPENVPFEFGEYSQHASKRLAARRGQVESFAQGNEADFQR